ncbi:hypothetical protein J6590_045783 [Homalodisca vitripennis]|nr:hypothetical protein J6590_045783 [Homalodisca vitripennis]
MIQCSLKKIRLGKQSKTHLQIFIDLPGNGTCTFRSECRRRKPTLRVSSYFWQLWTEDIQESQTMVSTGSPPQDWVAEVLILCLDHSHCEPLLYLQPSWGHLRL